MAGLTHVGAAAARTRTTAVWPGVTVSAAALLLFPASVLVMPWKVRKLRPTSGPGSPSGTSSAPRPPRPPRPHQPGPPPPEDAVPTSPTLCPPPQTARPSMCPRPPATTPAASGTPPPRPTPARWPGSDPALLGQRVPPHLRASWARHVEDANGTPAVEALEASVRSYWRSRHRAGLAADLRILKAPGGQAVAPRRAPARARCAGNHPGASTTTHGKHPWRRCRSWHRARPTVSGGTACPAYDPPARGGRRGTGIPCTPRSSAVTAFQVTAGASRPGRDAASRGWLGPGTPMPRQGCPARLTHVRAGCGFRAWSP
ncbi:hypothetical protein Gobs01_03624 [Geodermatophilus obscurus DSM 43160]|uniref:Uncharacterized protein n=1 Tax=Geodermatophilus obscurus (strain ATCC 25078 / DSM 43160 / JCM 3152 / CCUG 61914 / KCC A-0152 / KCTC 9177 / NBRC 13315 / NRRL B-3577 / G-20) TaxID=526225 RepID=D2SBH2_GEOOG|nr:hypothetical protein Gobs_3484 [Geodermatophilus obscurus DSM 43160]